MGTERKGGWELGEKRGGNWERRGWELREKGVRSYNFSTLHVLFMVMEGFSYYIKINMLIFVLFPALALRLLTLLHHVMLHAIVM